MRPTDSIAQIEQQLAHADHIVKDGDTLNLLVKPSTTTTAEMASDDSKPSDLKGSPSLSPSTGVLAGRGHQRIPSVVLSPSPSAEAPPGDLPSSSGSSSPSIRSRQNNTTRDITPTLNNAAPVLAVQELSTYHASIANPPVLVGPARVSGTSLPPADAQLAFEEFLRAAKGTLTIARLREPGGRHRHGRVLGATRRVLARRMGGVLVLRNGRPLGGNLGNILSDGLSLNGLLGLGLDSRWSSWRSRLERVVASANCSSTFNNLLTFGLGAQLQLRALRALWSSRTLLH
ncbi:hypothetical protein C8J57DRAFT_1710457 [Mycena rebaudengoi]|nr:hypothetical protein C8J57DRAFT_1710457 [Mycena rebaudengoi]